MKRALALVPLCIWACGGEGAGGAPPETAADAAAVPADAPASAGDAPPADKPGGAEEGWAGEKEAKAETTSGSEGPAETRTMEVIQKVVKDNRQPVRDCMDKVQKQLPDLAGDMVIHFVLDPEGKVKKAELNVERSSVKNPEVADCAVKVILGLKFPPSSQKKESEVNYPFNFKKKQ